MIKDPERRKEYQRLWASKPENKEKMRLRYQKLKADPVAHERFKAKAREGNRKRREMGLDDVREKRHRWYKNGLAKKTPEELEELKKKGNERNHWRYHRLHGKEKSREYTRRNREKLNMKQLSRWRRKQAAIKADPARLAAYKETMRRNTLRRSGWTVEEYAEVFNSQGGVCAMAGCGRPAEHADHDHQTGNRREILCRFCNMSLGMGKENPILFRSWADYVEKHSTPVP